MAILSALAYECLSSPAEKSLIFTSTRVCRADGADPQSSSHTVATVSVAHVSCAATERASYLTGQVDRMHVAYALANALHGTLSKLGSLLYETPTECACRRSCTPTARVSASSSGRTSTEPVPREVRSAMWLLDDVGVRITVNASSPKTLIKVLATHRLTAQMLRPLLLRQAL